MLDKYVVYWPLVQRRAARAFMSQSGPSRPSTQGRFESLHRQPTGIRLRPGQNRTIMVPKWMSGSCRPMELSAHRLVTLRQKKGQDTGSGVEKIDRPHPWR
jgi:hypothetical protein